MAANQLRPTSIKLDETIRDRIQRLADARRRTSHWLMVEAINQYVDREEKREALRQAAHNAWDEYQETGLHATVEEVDAWLASWGTNSELPPPACRK
ncbi:CopG family ribbon-helix-helix protein [Chitinimonas sp. JJ19]|uniref:CopG family ribbon-helix-helix protein n=1 Tax=Chitinimonas sp. JJ19 TaxID=3109352 RepID=UPI001A5B2617|nr:CopG family ribbon-helix-helix protein [Chitinimonas sp.]